MKASGASGRVVVELRPVPRVTIAVEAIVFGVDCPWRSLRKVTGLQDACAERTANVAN